MRAHASLPSEPEQIEVDGQACPNQYFPWLASMFDEAGLEGSSL